MLLSAVSFPKNLSGGLAGHPKGIALKAQLLAHPNPARFVLPSRIRGQKREAAASTGLGRPQVLP